jgi:Ser/Thr protein kinase RdoA (MazF antagonist)
MDENKTTSEQLISILNKYSFGELVLPIEQLTNGWTNSTYKFSTKHDGKTYILREYLPGTLRKISLESIKFELDFLTYLFNEVKLPVAPMINPPGIFQINKNYGVIFPFIDGIKYLDTPETPVRQLWQTLEISRFLGRMHSNITTKKYPLIPSNRRCVNLIEVKYELVHSCEEFEKEHPDLYQRIRLITDEYTKSIPLISDEDERNLFEQNLEKNLPIGYIHADIHDDNVLFCSNENKLAAVLDFDDMFIGPLLNDLAMSLCSWCGIGSTLNFEYVKEFLIVYQNERQMLLTDDEWNLLEVYCYLTVLNQILFVIEADECAKPMRNMINELLLPIEQLAKERKMFLEIIQQIK